MHINNKDEIQKKSKMLGFITSIRHKKLWLIFLFWYSRGEGKKKDSKQDDTHRRFFFKTKMQCKHHASKQLKKDHYGETDCTQAIGGQNALPQEGAAINGNSAYLETGREPRWRCTSHMAHCDRD